MPVRHSRYIAGVITIAALGTGAMMAPAAQAAQSRVQLVHQGQSIQAAIDAAHAGDTVLVMPGTYRESVQITKNVTLKGVAAGQVTLMAPAGQGAPAAPAAPAPAAPAPGTAPATAPAMGAGAAPVAGHAMGSGAQTADHTVGSDVGQAADHTVAGGAAQAADHAMGSGAGQAADHATPSSHTSVAGSSHAAVPGTAPASSHSSAPASSHAVAPGTAPASSHSSAPGMAPGMAPVTSPAGTQSAAPAATPDGTAPAATKTETSTTTTATTTQAACAAAGHGICVTGADGRALNAVRIESLTVSGFRANGIDVSGTDRMVVRQVTVKNNGQQGISQEKSTRAVLRDNEAVGNGQSGIFVANLVNAEGGALDTKGTVVAGNTLSGNRIGVTVRRARVLTVENNTVTGNCGGVFVVGDENSPKAGDLDVRKNKITDNNKLCAATDRLPVIQGTGVLLTGAEDTRVTDNTITGNTGTSPMSGGVVLFASEVGVANQRNQVSGNVLSGNSPADLADRDANGTDNTFSANSCSVSEPAGRC